MHYSNNRFGTHFAALLIGLFGIITLVLAGCGQRVLGQNVIPTPFPLGVTTIVERMPENLGIVVDATMNVLHVEAGGGADLAGIQVGDKIDSINDLPAAKNKDAIKALIFETQKERNKALVVKVIRGGSQIELQAIPQRAPSQQKPGAPQATVTPVFAPDDYF